jgi:glycosyltransferase involved in cell wall biosynthesis
MSPMLVFFHCGTNSGYAITRLERVFLDVARRVTGSDAAIHFAYPDLSGGRPEALPADFSRVVRFDPASSDRRHLRGMEDYVRTHGITTALGFDQPVRRPGYAALRRGGVSAFVSYWGAPMSSVNQGLTLALKRLDVRLARHGPDHYLFESIAMQRTAVDGRGIPRAMTSVSYLGVDTETFRPTVAPDWYAHDTFGIPRDRRIVYYSGHMEERKGIRVLVNAAVELVEGRGVRDVHFLLLGNQPGEEAGYVDLYRGRLTEAHITFGGYRRDVERIIPGAYVGAIASTGWDSFTMSSLEIAACGVPLVVSRLPGLDETVDDGSTGYTFPVGDHSALADHLSGLIRDERRRDEMSRAARHRVMSRFTEERQVESIASAVRAVAASRAPDGR